jgi:ATP-dependent exoDNAse (exonuclease V) beta subunit|tara:strand:- start:4568 stop:5395 length:828 start_codon:yes stop_codon:yes gene_type:complete
MAIIFKEEDHIYESIDENLEKDNITWTSVTSFIGKFKPKFDAKKQAKKSSKNKRSKWYGMTPKEILEAWDGETKRAIKLGNWYHNEREDGLLEFNTIEREGVEVPIIKPIIDGTGVKIAPEQKLKDGVYPEHLAYLKSSAICGQADLVTVVNGKVTITDYKTNKEIKEKGFTNWEGITAKMYKPLSHLDDCNINHYNLQLSIYMYIILKHNPKLKPGKLIIQHVAFEKEGENAHGYPITKYDSQGEPIIKNIKIYDLKYMKDEVRSLIMWLKDKK